MKIIIEFNPDDPDDAHKLKMYQQATDRMLCMDEFGRELHKLWDHGGQTGQARKVVDAIWKLWNDCKVEYKVEDD